MTAARSDPNTHTHTHTLDKPSSTTPLQPLSGDARKAAEALVISNHYAHLIPSGKTHVFKFEDAVVLFSIPANKNIGKYLLGRECSAWELTRLWAPDGHRKDLLTQAISAAVQGFKAAEPKCEVLVSYADPNVGHKGGIYRAASWVFTGQSEESRYYRDATGQVVSRRKFHSGSKKHLTKAEILALGYVEAKLPGKWRFAIGLTRRARNEIRKRWARVTMAPVITHGQVSNVQQMLADEPVVKDWREKRKKRLIVTSATQHESFSSCNRQWWLARVRGLEQPQTFSQTFGSVLHSVAERYLEADELGRDKNTGLPVDLYPPGWEIARDKWDSSKIEGTIPVIEQDLIKKLVAKAIEDGILSRAPWRLVEQQFRRTIIQLGCSACGGEGINKGGEKCPECGGDGKGTHVQITGYIDLIEADGIQDHKSAKSMRYAKSAKALRSNTQMLIYAYQFIEEFRANGWPLPPKIKLRHNVYCKDPENPTVRKTDVEVTPDEVELFWKTTIVENSKKMDHYRRNIEIWSQIPDPPSLEVCNAYGGCAFKTICAGRESETGYEQRLARFSKQPTGVLLTVNGTTPYSVPFGGENNSPFAKGSAMNFETRLAERRAVTAGANQPGQVNPPVPPGGYAQPPAPSAPQGFNQPQASFGPPQGFGPPPAQPHAIQPQQPMPQPVQQQGPPPPQPMPQQQVGPQVSMPPPAPPISQMTAPPWADPACKACGGWGFNKNGNNCRICDATAKQKNGYQSTHFNTQIVGAGAVYWQSLADPNMNGWSPLPQATAPAVSETRAPTAPAEQPQQPMPQPVQQQGPPPPQPMPQHPVQPAGPPQGFGPAPAQQQGPAPAPTPTNEEEGATGGKKGGQGRPPKSFILMLNVPHERGMESRGDRQIIHLDKELQSMMDYIVKSINEERMRQNAPLIGSFFEINAFDRRDMISRMVPEFAKSLGTSMVSAQGVGYGASEMKTLVDGLRPFAGMVLGKEHN